MPADGSQAVWTPIGRRTRVHFAIEERSRMRYACRAIPPAGKMGKLRYGIFTFSDR